MQLGGRDSVLDCPPRVAGEILDFERLPPVHEVPPVFFLPHHDATAGLPIPKDLEPPLRKLGIVAGVVHYHRLDLGRSDVEGVGHGVPPVALAADEGRPCIGTFVVEERPTRGSVLLGQSLDQ